MRTRFTTSPRDREILQGLASRIDPGDAGAHNNLGVLFFNKGMIEEAVEELHRALEIEPGRQVTLRNLEIAYLATGYYEELTESLAERLRAEPEDSDARWRLAQAHRHSGRFEEAAAELRRLLASSPSNLRLLLELGRTEKAAGRFGEALRAYERARGVDPKSAVLHLHLGELFYHQGNSALARRELLTATELEPRLGEAWHLLSFALGDLGEDDRAAEALERAQHLRPELMQSDSGLSIDRNSSARYEELVGERKPRPATVQGQYLGHFNLGSAFRQQGLYDEALREFAKSEEQGEDPAMARQGRAEVLLLAGRDREAADLYRELVAGDQESPKLWNELGVALHRLGDLGEAERCYRRALQLHGEYALAANNLGVARADGGDVAGAGEAFEGAVAAADGFAEPLCNLGLLALGLRRRRESLGWYRRAVEADADSAAGWTGVGAVLSEIDQLEEARHAFARAVEIDPLAAEAHYRLAFVLNRLGDLDGSLRETRRALGLDPYFTAPRYRLSIELQFENAEVLAPSLSSAGELGQGAGIADFHPGEEELASIFEQLRLPAKRPPQDAEAGYGLAEDYLSKGLLARALAEIRRVVLADGDPVEAALLSGEVFRRQNLEGEALERFETALTRLEGTRWSAQQERAWLGRGWSLLALGRAESAAEAAAVVEARSPSAAEPRRLHAEALLLMGRAEEALDRFTRLAEEVVGSASILMRVGSAARAAGHLGRAKAAYEAALEADRDLLAARVALGSIYLEEGSLEPAVEHGRRALEALPGYAEASLLLADAEHGRGDSRAAVRVLAELLEEDLYHLPALFRLGEILEEAGEAADAATAFRRALRFDPARGSAWLRLGDALNRLGDGDEASECWARAAEIGVPEDLEGVLRSRIQPEAPGVGYVRTVS